jgi:DNA-binding NtrC family response regulator
LLCQNGAAHFGGMTRSILIVDDDARIRTSLAQALAAGDTEVRSTADGERALAAMAAALPDLVLADVRMPGVGGLELLRLLRERAPGVDVVLMTAFDDLPTVATAMREGALDFLVKPVDLHQLRALVARIFDDRRTRSRGAAASDGNSSAEPRARPASSAAEVPILLGRDPRMVQIFKVIGQVAASRAPVLIRGESGTGKELIAQAIHASSPAAADPFVAVNCTALPATLLESELFGHLKGSFTGALSDRRGRFALAGRGTIFLDEIGDTTPDFQAKLLRVLQQHEYYPVGAERPERMAARTIAATHRDLKVLLDQGEFRQDLYYRLRVVEISLPPLRERLGDVPLLAEHLVRKAADAIGRRPPVLSDEASTALLRHGWPGNVRELENSLTRAVLLATGDVIRPDHLALDRPSAEAAPGLLPLAELERRHVQRVLKATGWHKTRAAELLEVSRPRLDRIIAKYALEADATGASEA